jgi:hypothetical protein
MPTKKEVAPSRSPEILSLAIREKLLALRKRADMLLAKTAAIKTEGDFLVTTTHAKDLKALRSELKSILGPLVKEAKAVYDGRRKALTEVDSILALGEDSDRLALETYREKKLASQEAKVEKALASGNDIKAAKLASQAPTPQAQGLSFTTRWHAEVTDLATLIHAVDTGKIPFEALEANLGYLNSLARAEHEKFSIPGVKAVSETSPTIREA